MVLRLNDAIAWEGHKAMAGHNWRLSPSDFAFLWEECKCCFYLKLVHDFPRPRSVMPKIFTVIDSEMKKCFSGKRTETIAPGLPAGTIQHGEKWVESAPIALQDRASQCHIRGKSDTVVAFDDGTYGVIDFKTSSTKEEHLPLYGRQLHAYAHALENAAPGRFALRPVRKLGLLVFGPETFSTDGNGRVSLVGPLRWMEIPRYEPGFFDFLKEVVSLLDQPSPPAPGAACDWCQYREASRRTGL